MNKMTFPDFKAIKPENIEKNLDALLQSNLDAIDTLLKQDTFTWENLIGPMETLDDRLNQYWSPIQHMHAVVSTPTLRDAYNACIPKLSDYATKIGHNKTLFEAIKSIQDSATFETLINAQKKCITNELRDFHLAGVDLPPEKKKQFASLQKKLSKASTTFSEHVLDATQGWTHLVTDKNELAGLPEHAIAAAKETAEAQNKTGWLFTLQFPSYLAVMSYADNAALREKMYEAFVTRASDQGPNKGKWDNTPIMQEILTLRKEIARLLGYQHYPEKSLVTKMASTSEEVLGFLNELAQASLPQAKEEFAQLCAFAKEDHGVATLTPWDTHYYSEKLRQKRFALSQEDLRPYFPEDHVLKGLFTVVNKLFNITVSEIKNDNTWHNDVRCFEIKDQHNEICGYFYIDLYARENKRGGAWMDECQSRRKLPDNTIQTPIAYLTCNFNAPVGGDPALLTHDDVLTLFHEFGHGLHHMLTKVDYTGVSGISGVPWDAVELPSQFLENWCWEKESLEMISSHYKTGETLPDKMIERLKAAKNFQSAMQMMRQLEFALFDFRVHLEFDEHKKNQIQTILDEVRRKVSVTPTVPYNRFQHSFSHIFAGGYSAGYYSYKWAEVLSSDAFSKFEEHGIFNPETGREFLQNILEQGGSEDPMTLFVKFRGRKPTTEALLRHSGIKT